MAHPVLPEVIPVFEQHNYSSIPIGYTTDVDGSWRLGSVYSEEDSDDYPIL